MAILEHDSRAAPAKLLGLADRGHLGTGMLADIAVYDRKPDTAAIAKGIGMREVRWSRDGGGLGIVPAGIAAQALEAGECNIVVVCKIMNTIAPVSTPQISPDSGGVAGDQQWEVPYGLGYAMQRVGLSARRYMTRYGITEEQVGWLVVTTVGCGGRAEVDGDQTDAVTGCAKLSVSGVTASGNDGHVPGNVLDGNLQTRWSSNGIGQHITLDLGAVMSVCSTQIAWYRGDPFERREPVLLVSHDTDDSIWQLIGATDAANTPPVRSDTCTTP